jgi:hypothetical protein
MFCFWVPFRQIANQVKMGINSMPIELLVPIGIFVVGILVSIAASGLGIERIIEGSKK